MPCQPRFASVIASGFLVVAGGLLSIPTLRAEEPDTELAPPLFASPSTGKDGPQLLNDEQGQRVRPVPEQQLREAAPDDLPPQIRAIQRGMGGSLLQHFHELQPAERHAPWWKPFRPDPDQPPRQSPIWPDPSAENAPPGMWPNWTSPAIPTTIRPASAEATAVRRPVPVTALRTTAAELDDAANRLEELELYPHSDALRELAQRFRVDARRLAVRGDAGVSPWAPPTDPTPQAPRRRAPGPTPDSAPTPSDPDAATADSPSESGDPGPDAWNAPSPQSPTPAE